MPMPACPRREVRGPIQAHKRAVSVSILLRYLADALEDHPPMAESGTCPSNPGIRARTAETERIARDEILEINDGVRTRNCLQGRDRSRANAA